MAEQALDALESVLNEVGLDVRTHETSPHNLDIVVYINGQQVAVEVKSIVRAGDADAIVRHAHELDLPLLVASERIAEPVSSAFKGNQSGPFG